MARTTVADMKVDLLANLDDASQTSFTDPKILQLLNNSLKYVVHEAASYNHYFRKLTETVTVIADTKSYVLPVNFRMPILIERTDQSDVRFEGTIIKFEQRNRLHARWTRPLVYFNWEENITVGEFRAHMVFAEHSQPGEGMTIDVHYAPEFNKLTDDNSQVTDIHKQYENLVILRATIQGFGGEKNADQFWMNQWTDAFKQAIDFWSNEGDTEVARVDNASGHY